MNFREFDFCVPIDTEQMNGSDLSHSFPDLEIISTESRAVKSRKEGSLGELNIEKKKKTYCMRKQETGTTKAKEKTVKGVQQSHFRAHFYKDRHRMAR